MILSLLFFVSVLIHSYAGAWEPFQSFFGETKGSSDEQHSPGKPRRVAIVGAGSAGASTAYFLKQQAQGSLDVDITVFEQNDYIGGRSTVVHAFGNPNQELELGASIFVKVNENLVSAAEALGLELEPVGSNRPKESGYALGVWDGYVFRYLQPESSPWWYDLAKLLWKYGLAPIRTRNLVNAGVGSFLRLYRPPCFPFKSLSDAARCVGLTKMTGRTGEALLQMSGISLQFAVDIIQASTRVNYASNLDQIHGLETLVSMAAEGAMAVKGGNWRIFDGMIQKSASRVQLNATVSKVSSLSNGSISIDFTSLDHYQQSRGLSETFDAVVICAPFQFSGIKISPEPEFLPRAIKYVQLHVTLFTSPYKLSSRVFNKIEEFEPPEVILTTTPNNGMTSQLEFFSISVLRLVSNPQYEPPRQEYAYKIFSPSSLNDTFVSSLLRLPKHEANEPYDHGITWMFRKTWNSYPRLDPMTSFEGPILDTNIFYTGGIESFISTMETSSLMGKNVARLLVDQWTDKKEAVAQFAEL